MKSSTKRLIFLKKSVITLASAALLASGQISAYQSEVHTFSVYDTLGDFEGSTYGFSGISEDKSIICGLPDSDNPVCPEDAAQPFVDKSGVTLYPVDSEFGFYVVDFVGAQEKFHDYDYGEGFVGTLPDGSGIAVSNAATDRFKVKPPQGTWCQGLGGNSVKCSTEHYTVMEHVLSCHEVIPYFFANPENGEQGTQETPDGSLSLDCATTALDDDLQILVDGEPIGGRLTDSTPGVQMDPNDNTSVLDDIAVSADYSVTLKDDGKALYRWGALIKRPNDMRFYARLSLPEEWKERDTEGNLVNDFAVTRAWLVVNHTITNNPNDQIRPEDLENEAAIGVLPDHTVENPGTSDEVWRSTKLCYEGDGDLIDTEEGTGDPTALGIGTFYKNMPFALDPAAMPGTEPEDDPYAFSADLTGALTNAWYTTIDREPFEWSYVVETEEAGVITVDYRGCPGPVEDQVYATLCTNVPEGTPLFSGPRWRLKPNKFGQDLPGLEIPVTAALEEPCTPPPFSQDLIKYEVGAPTTTIINLLDWDEEEGPSPLANSKGWVDSAAYNEFIEIVDTVIDANGEERQVTSIGGPMSEDFDVMIYVKGDRKPTFLYNAQLFIDYEGEPPVEEVDAELTALLAPATVNLGDTIFVTATVTNNGLVPASGSVELTGVTSRGAEIGPLVVSIADLPAGENTTVTFSYVANTHSRPYNIDWTATVVVENDTVPDNDTATASTKVKK